MRLNKVQKKFRETILDPAAMDGEFRAVFKPGGISAENRMKVYRNNVIKTLTNAVVTVYPLTEKLVGTDFLKGVVERYVVANLPDQGNLNFYGATFADFLTDYEPVRHLPYLPDMARLEWAWECATLAGDDAPLPPAALQEIPEDRLPDLRLPLRASVHLLQSNFPLDRIVDFCRTENPQGTLDIGNNSGTDANTGKTHLMIFRPELQAQMRKIGAGEFIFLRALKDGNHLMNAAEWATRADETFDLAATLQRHLQLGTFKTFGD